METIKIFAFIVGTIINALVLGLLYCIFMFIKNEVTYRQHMKIIDAIHDYTIDCLNEGVDCLVDYTDMEPYDNTCLRIWDFGYTRILPKDKFVIIKPYIDDRKKG